MKVLIISHNPISSLSSIGKTLKSLFCKFSKEELCQIYIHKGLPDSDMCSVYYRFTDKDVLKGVFTRKVSGTQTEPKQDLTADNSGAFNAVTYGSSNKREPYMELLRETVWKLSPWYNKTLKEWVRDQKPTCIFAAIGSGTFLYDIAIKISKDFNIPIITYICDDFYNMARPQKLLGGLWKHNINNKTKQLFSKSRAVIGICDRISESYGKEFKTEYHTVMTGTNFTVRENIRLPENVNKISYFGKLSINRYISLLEICRSLDEINKENRTDYEVSVFCDKPDYAIIKAFSNVSSAKFCGFVSGDDFKKEFFSSDALLFFEAFDKESIDRVKNSVSTKIADSLASGIPLFAYAPRGIAATEHLCANDCAVVCSNKADLKSKLKRFLEDKDLRQRISNNAIKTAKRYHDPLSVSNQLYGILTNCSDLNL